MGEGARRVRISEMLYSLGKAAAHSASYQTSCGAGYEMVAKCMPLRSGECGPAGRRSGQKLAWGGAGNPGFCSSLTAVSNHSS